MKNIYLKEELTGGVVKKTAYTTLMRLLSDMNKKNIYTSVRRAFLKGKSFDYFGVTISKVELVHYKQNQK